MHRIAQNAAREVGSLRNPLQPGLVPVLVQCFEAPVDDWPKMWRVYRRSTSVSQVIRDLCKRR
jgi:hypothetical protein